MYAASQVDFGVIKKYFIFLVSSVFVGSFVSGALFNQFEQWIKDPGSAVDILGTALPLTSIFFLTYVELQARRPVCKTGCARRICACSRWISILEHNIASCLQHLSDDRHTFTSPAYLLTLLGSGVPAEYLNLCLGIKPLLSLGCSDCPWSECSQTFRLNIDAGAVEHAALLPACGGPDPVLDTVQICGHAARKGAPVHRLPVQVWPRGARF